MSDGSLICQQMEKPQRGMRPNDDLGNCFSEYEVGLRYDDPVLLKERLSCSGLRTYGRTDKGGDGKTM